MKTVIGYIDVLKEKTGSDYKTAKELNVDKTCISHIRKRGLMSDETAIKIADYLGVDRAEVLIAAAMARSNEEARASWLDAARRLGVAASLAGMTLAPSIFGHLTCILC